MHVDLHAAPLEHLRDKLPATASGRAASLLWRIGHRTGPLTEYQRRFCAAYGRQRLVPLLDALDPVTGLGPPGPHDAIGTDEAPDARRTAALARLLADALSDGKGQLVLTEQVLDRHLHHLPPALAQQDTHDTKIETNLTESSYQHPAQFGGGVAPDLREHLVGELDDV
ncbi:lantibiotic dehydratase [Streptomyces niphimycinicus]|uniref:lantibiotic dehydratase n=1 Tax=Streptomyces niphimycinicus TaxID=2842201 RepID=UPI00263B777D|nr:lantibiotic dehydratase [Streptomyces niphimycinicus]